MINTWKEFIGNMATIFKQMENLKVKLLREAQQVATLEEHSELQAKLDLLQTISEYCLKGEWLNRSSAAERFTYYMTHTPEECAEKFDCDISSVYSSMTNYSRRFENLVGSDIVKKIEMGKVAEAKMQFLIGINNISVSALLFDEAVKALPEADSETEYTLTDCANELKFLRICSFAYFQSIKDKVDMNKVAYIRAVLDGKVKGQAESRAVLYKFLGETKSDLQSTMEKLKNIQEVAEGIKI